MFYLPFLQLCFYMSTFIMQECMQENLFNILRLEWPKLRRVLATLRAKGFKLEFDSSTYEP